MVIASAGIVPASNGVDEARGVQRFDHSCQAEFGSAISRLAPTFVVDHLNVR